MLRKDERKAEIERIRTDTNDSMRMSRWLSTMTAVFLLSIGMDELVTGQIRSWQSAGVLLWGLLMASYAVWGWHVAYRRKQHKP